MTQRKSYTVPVWDTSGTRHNVPVYGFYFTARHCNQGHDAGRSGYCSACQYDMKVEHEEPSNYLEQFRWQNEVERRLRENFVRFAPEKTA